MSGQLYLEGDSFLHRLNPAVKLCAFSILMIAPALFLRPAAPAAFIGLSLLLGWGLGGITPAAILRRLIPFLLLATGLVIFNTLFYGGPRSTLLMRLGPVSIWAEALAVGASIGLRLLCFASFSALFVWTTDPALLVASLMHQFRLPYRLAYAMFAAYRFLPLLRRELDNIRAAHRVRGAFADRGLASLLERSRRYGVPLLANALRQTERMAVAMDARGFSASPHRTSYLRPRVCASDILFLGLTCLATAAILFGLAQWGLLGGFLSGPAESLVGGAP